VVAVLLGYFVGGEELGVRTITGTLLVLVSVIVITTAPKNQPQPSLSRETELAER
jgi:drug/metabolite transporter (DMT)-like permease